MDDQEPLVRAMPRRPLYNLKGFIAKIDLDVLSAVAEEGWCATREAIAADVDSKEVRLGVVVVRRGGPAPEGLVAAGQVLHVIDIPPEAVSLPELKQLALATARSICPAVRGVELAGYWNDDAQPELRRVLLLVYRAMVPPGSDAPEGAAWQTRAALAGATFPAPAGEILPAIA